MRFLHHQGRSRTGFDIVIGIITKGYHCMNRACPKFEFRTLAQDKPITIGVALWKK